MAEIWYLHISTNDSQVLNVYYVGPVEDYIVHPIMQNEERVQICCSTVYTVHVAGCSV